MRAATAQPLLAGMECFAEVMEPTGDVPAHSATRTIRSVSQLPEVVGMARGRGLAKYDGKGVCAHLLTAGTPRGKN